MKSLKIFICGDSFTGTSSIIDRFVDDIFDKHCLQTIGVDFRTKRSDKFLFEIYVASGIFLSTAKFFVKKCDFFIFVYDITNVVSFENVRKYYNELISNVQGNSPTCFLVGNKTDLTNRKISKIAGGNLAIELGMIFYETSALANDGINELFQEIEDLFVVKSNLGKERDQSSSNWFLNIFSCCQSREKKN